LLLDFDELRDEGEGGAETGDGAEDFDGLRRWHLAEISSVYFSRGSAVERAGVVYLKVG
jgi:hypothetical protein